MTNDDEKVDLESVILGYLADVDSELAERMKAYPPDFAQIQVNEVVGGLLARQATLAKEIASAPSLWNGHSAPIMLRAMADVHINLAWLLIDPPDRCLKYISFGLGQAKLELEHRRAEIGTRTPTPDERAMLEAREAWIDSQRATFLQDVDLGKWSGLSVRAMADEAGCIDFSVDDRNETMHSFTIFSAYLKSLQMLNERLGTNRLSMHADLLQQRSTTTGIPFKSLMAADFVLYLRAASVGGWNRWWPNTLVYVGRFGGAFELFARAKSSRYFDRFKAVIGVNDKKELGELFDSIEDSKSVPRWQFESVNIRWLSNFEALATSP